MKDTEILEMFKPVIGFMKESREQMIDDQKNLEALVKCIASLEKEIIELKAHVFEEEKR